MAERMNERIPEAEVPAPVVRGELSPEAERERLEDASVSAARLVEADADAVREVPVKDAGTMRKLGNWARSRALVTSLALLGATGVLGGGKAEAQEGRGREAARELTWILGAEADSVLYEQQMRDIREMEDHRSAIYMLESELGRLRMEHDQLQERLDWHSANDQRLIKEALARDDGQAIQDLTIDKLQTQQRMQRNEDQQLDIKEAMLDHEEAMEEGASKARKKESIRQGVRIGTRIFEVLTRPR